MTITFDNLKDQKKQIIINKALLIFAEKGYELASTNVLTKELGISKGSLFKYFETKLGLYQYLVELSSDKLINYINEHIDESADWRTSLLNYASVEFDFMLLDPLTLQFFRRVIKDMDLDVLSPIADYLNKRSKNYLEQIYSKVTLPESVALHVTFIVKGYSDWFNETYTPVVAKHKEIYIQGLKDHLNLIKMEV